MVSAIDHDKAKVESEPCIGQKSSSPWAKNGSSYGLPPSFPPGFCPMQNRPLGFACRSGTSIPVGIKKKNVHFHASNHLPLQIPPLMSGENLGFSVRGWTFLIILGILGLVWLEINLNDHLNLLPFMKAWENFQQTSGNSNKRNHRGIQKWKSHWEQVWNQNAPKNYAQIVLI